MEKLNKILRSNELGLYKSRPEVLIAADMVKRFTNKKGKIDYENAQFIIGKELKGTETLDELLQLERSTRVTETPKVSEVETVSKNFNKEPTRLADDQNNVKDFV